MTITNIMMGGVGGQGLVLMTKLVGTAAFYSGKDVQTGDVIGLSQRGGRVWGSVRFGDVVPTPVIPAGKADIVLGLERLEGFRWLHLLKDGGFAVLNREEILPNRALLEKDMYPSALPEGYPDRGIEILELDAYGIAEALGNRKAFNSVLVGALSVRLDIIADAWQRSIEENVPRGSEEVNLRAFHAGRQAAMK